MAISQIGYIRRVANENDAPNRIRELREAKGLKQNELARLASTDPSTINKLEKGGRGLDLDWLFRLAPHLDCEPADLLPRSANRYLLDNGERSIIDRVRAADERGREDFERVADSLLGRDAEPRRNRA